MPWRFLEKKQPETETKPSEAQIKARRSMNQLLDAIDELDEIVSKSPTKKTKGPKNKSG